MPSVISALGAGLAVYLSYRIADFVWLYARPSGLRRYLYAGGGDGGGKPLPAWALVTGATDGIGKALSHELAAEGFDLVLHGRDAGKLGAVRDELARAHPARSFRLLVADAFVDVSDFAPGGDSDGRLDLAVRAAVRGLHLTVLVNCAGAGPRPSFGALERYGVRDVLDTVHLNAAFPALVTRAVLTAAPAFLGGGGGGGAGAGGPALVINVASVTDAGVPLVSFYGASKAFGHVLSLALGREMLMEERNVEVISHRVGATTATSHERRVPSLFWPAAGTVARAVLARTGCGRRSVVPYWPHALQQLALGLLPAAVLDRVMVDAMRERRTEQDAAAAAARKET